MDGAPERWGVANLRGIPGRDMGQALRAAGGEEREGAAAQGLDVLPWEPPRWADWWAPGPVGFLASCPYLKAGDVIKQKKKNKKEL